MIAIRDTLVRLLAVYERWRKECADAIERILACLIGNCLHFLQRCPSDLSASWAASRPRPEASRPRPRL